MTPKNAMHYANTIGSMARGYDRACRILQNDIANQLKELGVPVRKQIIK